MYNHTFKRLYFERQDIIKISYGFLYSHDNNCYIEAKNIYLTLAI